MFSLLLNELTVCYLFRSKIFILSADHSLIWGCYQNQFCLSTCSFIVFSEDFSSETEITFYIEVCNLIPRESHLYSISKRYKAGEPLKASDLIRICCFIPFLQIYHSGIENGQNWLISMRKFRSLFIVSLFLTLGRPIHY